MNDTPASEATTAWCALGLSIMNTGRCFFRVWWNRQSQHEWTGFIRTIDLVPRRRCLTSWGEMANWRTGASTAFARVSHISSATCTSPTTYRDKKIGIKPRQNWQGWRVKLLTSRVYRFLFELGFSLASWYFISSGLTSSERGKARPQLYMFNSLHGTRD